jgi:hypothetical protein
MGLCDIPYLHESDNPSAGREYDPSIGLQVEFGGAPLDPRLIHIVLLLADKLFGTDIE